jgi:hypothetical protein
VPHTAPISRANPSCFLFVIDQSGSMEGAFGGDGQGGQSKAQHLASAMNNLLQTLVMRCAKGEEIRHYFDVGVIGYGVRVGPALTGALAGRELVSVSDVAFNPACFERRFKAVADDSGRYIEQSVEFPVWLEPRFEGNTPMCEAIRTARRILASWISRHPNAYPPTVIHITDGESTDGDATSVASDLTSLATSDGFVTLFNCHLSSTQAPKVTFPDSDEYLPDQFSRALFRMSSLLPVPVYMEARQRGYSFTDESRAFFYNADALETVDFLAIGTRTREPGDR